MELIIRAARPSDADQMAELLNEIIALGGTTAFLEPIPAELMTTWMTKDAGRACWQVAVDASGRVVGYQSAEPRCRLPADCASMASFVRIGCAGQNIGTKLFEATKTKTRALGYTWLNATILSDNISGLTYYEKMGFRTWQQDNDQTLSNGRVAGKVHKRRDL